MKIYYDYKKNFWPMMRWTWFEVPPSKTCMFCWIIVSRQLHFHIYYLFVGGIPSLWLKCTVNSTSRCTKLLNFSSWFSILITLSKTQIWLGIFDRANLSCYLPHLSAIGLIIDLVLIDQQSAGKKILHLLHTVNAKEMDDHLLACQQILTESHIVTRHAKERA
jgi:hypothetical protein